MKLKMPAERTVFPESKLAHKYLDSMLNGIEIGASLHNPFTMPGKKNVDYTASEETPFKKEEKRLYGECHHVDIVANGDCLPLPRGSQDYVIASHVLEHMPDAIRALREWARVTRDGGILYIVVPHRDADPKDVGREPTGIIHFYRDFIRGETVDSHPTENGHEKYGHYHVFDMKSFLELIEFSNVILSEQGMSLRVIDSLEVCDKVPNGHAFVLRVNK